MRLRWGIDEANAATLTAYSLRDWIEASKATARNGLSDSEAIVFDRYLKAGQSLLDVGCGGGREAFGFAQRGLCVTGVDLTPEITEHAREAARSFSGKSVPSFSVGSITQLGFPAASFDAVYISSDIFASIPGTANRISALTRCRKLLRPGGVVIFAVTVSAPVPLRVRAIVEGSRAVLRRLAPEYIPERGDRWNEVRIGTEAATLFRHYFYSEAEVSAEIEAAGLHLMDRVSDYFIARPPVLQVEAPPIPRFGKQAHPSVTAQAFADQMLLVQLEQGTAYSLNRTARLMWDLAAEGCSASEIADRLQARFDLPRERLEADAAALIQELQENSLLRKREMAE